MKTILLSTLSLFIFVFSYSQNIYSLKGVEGIKGIQFDGIQDLNQNRIIFDINGDFTTYKNVVRNAALDAPNSKLTASLAYDVNNNKLVFMPMLSSFIYIQDIATGNITSIDGIKEIDVVTCDAGTQFSRMTLASDGNVYALSNNFSQLIKINSRLQSVENLGEVKLPNFDTQEDKTTWGGDLVSDNQKNLYLISAQGKVFKIDLDSQMASELGAIRGLPADYTSNGAAVLADGRIIVSNSRGNSFYQFTLDNLQAKPYVGFSSPSYDLASQFFIPVDDEAVKLENMNAGLSIYPTIVNDKQFNIGTDKNLQGVSVQIFDTNSNVVAEFNTRSLQENSDNTFSLPHVRPNIYIVKAFDASGNEILNQKITVVK